MVWPISVANSSYSMSVAGYSESLKRLTNATFGRLQAFLLYGGLGISTSSLHRESTDSLIHYTIAQAAVNQTNNGIHNIMYTKIDYRKIGLRDTSLGCPALRTGVVKEHP